MKNCFDKLHIKHTVIKKPNHKILKITNELPKLNVVLDLDRCLVHIRETKTIKWMNRNLDYFETGDITVAKRPGVDFFLWSLVEKGYNCYLYTENKYKYANPIIDTLEVDAGRPIFKKRVYYDSCVDFDHSSGKDLRNLNLDLKRTILIDDDPINFKKQPKNSVHLRPFVDDDKYIDLSEDLYHILGFLDAIELENDVRYQDLENVYID